MATKKATLQEQLHWVRKAIIYHNPASPYAERRITPQDNLLLDFPHLADEEILLLHRMKVILPATDAEIRQHEAAQAAAAAEAEAAARAEAEAAANSKAAMKAAANSKASR